MTSAPPPCGNPPEESACLSSPGAVPVHSSDVFLRSAERLSETPIKVGAELVYRDHFSMGLAVVHAVETDEWGFHITLRDGHARPDAAAKDIWIVKAPWSIYTFRGRTLRLSHCRDLFFSPEHIAAAKEVARVYPDAQGLERYERIEAAFWLRHTGHPL